MKFSYTMLITIIILIIFSNTNFAMDRVSLGFIYNSTDSIELVDRTNGAINQVSPTCLNINSRGNLVVTSDLTHEFVDAMKERDILVTPFLSNHWVRSRGRAAIKNTEAISDQIIEVIEEYRLDGINVDIENLTSNDKDDFSEFVRVLSEKLPEDKILSVSVAANPDGKEIGWQGSYDYKKLGEYSDYLYVMAYDENSQGGECGPVASLEFVEKSVQYALKYVPKNKIVLGIPLYGRYWKEGESNGGEAVVIGAIPGLISKNHGIVKFDEKKGEACVTFSIDESKIKSKINGVELTNGNYIIWYQNEESIKSKLNIVNQYDLLGAGVWALGQEKVEVWEYYKNELNKIPYKAQQEQKIIKEYEALVIDTSSLKEPDIYPLKYIKNVILDTEYFLIESEEDEHYHLKEKSIDSVEVIKNKDFTDLETKKIKSKTKELSKAIVVRKIRFYRLNRK